MPNWCDNTVRVRADAKTLTRIREAVKGTVFVRPWNDEDPSVPLPLRAEASLFSLHAVLPQPDGALEPDDPRRASTARTSKMDGDEWREQNWGTKWEEENVRMAERAGAVVYIFQTAWSPPVAVIQRLSEQFPTARISLSFAEPLALGRGNLQFQGGVLLRVASLSGAWAYGLRQLLP